jgi:hypothetical protein
MILLSSGVFLLGCHCCFCRFVRRRSPVVCRLFCSRLSAEQRPLKRDEDGSFIAESKECDASAVAVAAVVFGGDNDMDDGCRLQQQAHSHDYHHERSHGANACSAGEERLVESLGAVAINKRRKIAR